MAASFEVFMPVVRMLKSVGSNVAGEVCGYSEELAGELVAKGMAVYVTAAPVEAVTKEVVVEAEVAEEPKGFLKLKKKKG